MSGSGGLVVMIFQGEEARMRRGEDARMRRDVEGKVTGLLVY
jgi:hypothetical protein